MKRFLPVLLALIGGLAAASTAWAQLPIEVACPAGSNPMPIGQTFNPTTGKFKQWLCVDASGNVSSNFTGSLIGNLTSSSSNPATTGFTRAASGDIHCWRNNANTADLCLSKDTTDRIVTSGFAGLIMPSAGWIVNTTNPVTFSVTNPSAARTYTVPDFGAADSFVGAIATQTLTNKTVTTPVINGASTGTGVQGTDTKLLTSGTISGTGTTLCTDAAGGATTSGCTVGMIVYSTASASTTASIAATTMATAGASGNTYRFSAYLVQTAVGVACTSETTVNVNLIWNDPQESATASSTLAFLRTTGTGNGALGRMAIELLPAVGGPEIEVNGGIIRAKASTVVQYSTTYTLGTACTTSPAYQIFPILEQLQ